MEGTPVEDFFFFAYLVLERSTSNLNLEVGRHTLIWVTSSVESLYKNMEEGGFCFLPACPHLASKSIPLLSLAPTSLGFQQLLKAT